MPRWTRETILGEILRRYETQQDLSYSGLSRDNLPLLRAAARHFGSYPLAVAAAGLDYDELRRYRNWTNDRIIERLQELGQQGADLSWRHVSLKLDPTLAAAAVKRHHFGSWRAALEAAGLDYDAIRRYHDWDEKEVVRRIRERHARGEPLHAKALERDDTALITAARRRFPAWHASLTAAGLNYGEIVLRSPSEKR
ncbi:hypothetical protein [Armatimonas rosea]|uniref:Uncharacterized protein n=1 Tax=Armatimonas rosea TaxID=685828 RepID=A0A7W9STZ5_ARMRO|nr:hypothetical protein [Armatimonas rosea]MBB6052003.1 hypothetical protein [Armatimonas rosea]